MNSWHNRCVVSVADFPSVVASSSVAVAVGAGDPGSSRLVYAMVIGLVVVGVALIVLAVWILRQTRPDLDVLAPLERMGDGDWKRRDPSTQRRMLDEVRPEGAEPLASVPPPPPIDADFEQADHPVASFSDLGPGVGGEVRDPTPIQTDLDLEPVDIGEPRSPTTEHDDAGHGGRTRCRSRGSKPRRIQTANPMPKTDAEPDASADVEAEPDADARSRLRPTRRCPIRVLTARLSLQTRTWLSW